MAGRTPQHDGDGRRVPAMNGVDDTVAEAWLRQTTECSQYSPRQQEVLSKAGQLILEWAVEVARYEADIDWQWIHRADDPAVTASALTRLIGETRSVVERAEALLLAAQPDEDR